MLAIPLMLSSQDQMHPKWRTIVSCLKKWDQKRREKDEEQQNSTSERWKFVILLEKGTIKGNKQQQQLQQLLWFWVWQCVWDSWRSNPSFSLRFSLHLKFYFIFHSFLNLNCFLKLSHFLFSGIYSKSWVTDKDVAVMKQFLKDYKVPRDGSMFEW